MTFVASHIDCRGSVPVALDSAEALDLFTPLGEKLWVPGWEPTILHPADGALAPDLAWTTGQPGQAETFWLTIEADRAARRVAYARLTPGSRLGRVEVRLEPAPAGGCIAHVRYAMTALSEAGNHELADFAANFPAMMEEWRTLLHTYLSR